MKNKILSFALPLLLVLSPVAAPAARLLWVDVRGSATVEDGDTNPTVGEYRSSGTGHSVNAFRVSVPDAEASGGTNYLAFAYEDNGSMVVGDTESVVRSLNFTDGGALWAPLDLAAYADRDLVVTMELGYVDPGSPSSFEKMAFATEPLGALLDAPHVSIQSDLNPPAVTPWAPMTFTVTVPWAIAYDLAGGTNNAVNPESYTEGQLPIALLPAGREGYTFAGWTNELGDVVTELAAGSTGDRSFGATWLENVEPPALGSKVYSGSLQTADVPASGGYAVTANAGGTNVGEYTVTLSVNDGYAWSDGTIADKTVTWSITPAEMTVLSADWIGVYDAEGHSPSATASVVEGTAFEYSLDGAAWSATAPAFTNVVATNVQIRAINPNFTTATTNVALTVTNRVVTLTGASGSVVYSGSAQTLDTFETDGLVQGHILFGVAYAATGTAVGTYPGDFSGTPAVTAPGDADVTANYDVVYAAGALTITPGTMTISVAGYEGVYDGASHDATATTQPAGATVTWSTDGGATWSADVPAILNAGTNEVIAQAVLANYATVTSEVAKLVVTPKPATITVEASEKVYGENDPAFTGTVEGLVADGDLGSVAYSRTNADVNYVGTYADVLTASYTANANYAVTVVPADFTIKPAAMTITVAGYEGVYDGASHDATATTQPTGATVTWSTDGGATWSADVPTIVNVGTNEVLAQAVLANYATVTSEVAKLIVTPKPVTITVASSSKTFGTEDPAFTGTIEGLVADGDLGEITYSRTNADEDVDTYAGVLTASYTANANYNVTVVPGDFEITAAAAMVISVADAETGATTTNYVATLADAFGPNGAKDGDTVELLANVTLTERVEPNVGANTAITIDLGGYTITREGTSGNGSAFDVKSGDVTITNGVIDCTQNDTAIAKDGVYAITSRSGSTVTLAGLTVTVDSECGACAYPFAGSTMTIESGTYANVTTTPYRYNTAITGMAVNQPNNATQNLVIKGGSFSQYDPQLGDDSGAMTDFTDDGFVAIRDGSGNWVVQPGWNVTFDANGGDPTPAAQRVAAGGKATAPTAPTKERYSFRAWQLNGADYDFETVLSSDITLVADWTMTAVHVAQVGETKYSTIADAIVAAGGLVANPEVITLLTNADASVTLTAPAQRLRVALDGHELTVLSGDPIRYEVATNVEDGVTVYALEQLKADGLMIVRFDYEAAKLAYDMGTAENMLRMYPTNEPIWCTIATATDLAAPLWTTVENSRAWKENLVPLANVTDADLEWLENLDTTSSPIRFWRIAVTPFKLMPNEEVGFKPPRPAGD